jgi:hypothetical protein
MREVPFVRKADDLALATSHLAQSSSATRGKKGRFTSRQADVGRSLSADRRSKAKTIVKKGEGDRGDRRSH